MPPGSDLHIDGPLSNIAVAYKNTSYIGDLIAPRVPVDKQSDKYYIWTKDYWFRLKVQMRAPGDEYPMGRMKISNTSYWANMYHLGYALNDEDVANQDAMIQLAQTGAEWLADQFLLHRENQLAADIFTTSIWDTDKTFTSAQQWNDFENSDPVSDMVTGQNAIEDVTGQVPNIFVISKEVWQKLREHPLLLEKFKYTGSGILTVAQVAQALDVPKIVIGRAIKVTTEEEASTQTYASIWGKHGLLLHVTPGPTNMRTATAMKTFAWKIDGPNGGNGSLIVPIKRVREDTRDRTLLQAKTAFVHKVVGSDLGYFFSGAVA